MSLFNHCVLKHPLAPFLLRSILWGQEDDPEKRYPLMGRVRYVYLADNYETICMLLKEGPTSKSKNKELIWEQIKRHETLVSWGTVKRDRSYIIARFKPVPFCYINEENGHNFLNELMFNLEKYDTRTMEIAKDKIGLSFQSLLDDPFVLMDRFLSKFNLKDLGVDYHKMVMGLKESIDKTMADKELSDLTKEAGISGYSHHGLTILELDEDGNMTDITDTKK